MSTPLKKVAIAEDDPTSCLLLKEMVESLGYECVGAVQNGQEAIELVRRSQPQILVLDLHMPIMDGLDALPQIVALQTTAVIVLTGDSNPQLAQKAMDLGANGYMQKPFDASQISASLESAWHQFRTICALHEKNKALDAALETRKLIEKAKGILMEQQGFSEDEAHRWLLKMSQDQGIPMKDVCRSVIQVRMVLGKKSKKAA